MKLKLSYPRLRRLMLCKAMQEDYPDWPYPLLFQGQEICRDIFFLDPLIEYPILRLGRNEVFDGAALRYRSLNQWFHYRFFNVISAVGYSAESGNLVPRLMRLRRVLLDKPDDPKIKSYLKAKLAVSDPARLISFFSDSVAQMVEICSTHPLVVWGIRIDERARSDHLAYIKDVVEKIPFELVFGLPHLRQAMRSTELLVLEHERTLLRASEARFARRKASDD